MSVNLIKLFFLTVLSCLFLLSGKVSAQPSPEVFKKLLHSNSNQVLEAACLKAPKFQYVFVTGIFNELMPYYFKDQIEWLTRCQVPSSQIRLARPYSGTGLTRSSVGLKELFQEMLSSHPTKPLMIIGHSKGAPEALLASLQSPQSIQQKIATIVCIQGSFGGSPIADLALGDDSATSSPNYRLVARIARRLTSWLNRVERFYGKSVRDGVDSIKTKEARAFWTQFINDSQNENILTENKVLVLQTYKHYRRLNPFFFLSGQYLNAITGEQTDGAIPLSSQRPPIPGIRPTVLELDHLDTVLPKQFSFSSPLIRYQIMSAIISAQNAH